MKQLTGVQSAETEFSSGKVTVTGTMDAEKLVEYLYRRTKKQARIVLQAQAEPEKPLEDPPKTVEEEEEKKKKEESGDQPKEEEAPAEAPPPSEEAKKEEGENNAGELAPPPPPPMMHMPLPLPPFAMHDDPMKRMMMYQYHYQPTYVFDRIPLAPQLFSDESPNACTIS